MNILSQENITTSVLLFLLMGAVITFWGSLVVYSIKKGKKKRKHEYK